MARVKNHDRSVICFDMNMELANAERAMKAFDYLMQMKRFVPTNKDDLMKLLLFNTEHEDGERNMYIPFTEFIPYKDFVKDAMKGNKPAASNWISAIRTAICWLCDVSDTKGLYTLQLIVFTDLSTPLNPDDNETVKKLTKVLMEYNIYLFILGPDVIEPNYITSVKDIQNWSTNIRYKKEEGCTFTRETIAKLVRDTEGIMCEPFLGIELLEIYRSTRGKQEWHPPLEVGHTGIELEVTTSRCIDLFTTPRVSSQLKPRIKFTVKGEEIPYDEAVNAFRIDEKIIVVPKDIKDNYIKDYNGPRMLKLVAFVSRDSIPEVYFFDGEAYCIEIPEGSSDAHALHTLIRTCYQMNRCGLAWRAYNRNNCPKLYALLPRLEPSCHFYMIPLARKDDIQLPYRGGVKDIHELPKGNSSSDYYQNVTKYLDMLSNDENKPALHPILTSGPWLTCFLQRLDHIKKRQDGEISTETKLPKLDLGRTKLNDEAVKIAEFLKNHLKQKEKEEGISGTEMQVDKDAGNDDDEW